MKALPKTVGERFGHLVVIRLCASPYSEVRCDCGVQKLVRHADLRLGKIASCGCQRGTHGQVQAA